VRARKATLRADGVFCQLTLPRVTHGRSRQDYEAAAAEAEAKHELDILRSLGEHPNICGVLPTPPRLLNSFIVRLTPLGHVTLRDHAAQTFSAEPAPRSQAAEIMHTLMSAVAYLHSCDVCHRRVCPSNVLLREDRAFCALMLCGFREARRFSRCDMSGVVGDRRFACPDMHRPSYNEKVDVWSAAATTACLLLPHQGLRHTVPAFRATLAKLVQRAPLEEACASLAGLADCLAPCPQRRASADSFLAALGPPRKRKRSDAWQLRAADAAASAADPERALLAAVPRLKQAAVQQWLQAYRDSCARYGLPLTPACVASAFACSF
jgi:serine/threonine protein kinase